MPTIEAVFVSGCARGAFTAARSIDGFTDRSAKMSRRIVCVMVVGVMSLTGCGATVQTFPSEPDASRTDAATPDGTTPDVVRADAGMPDAVSPDGATPDVVSPDIPYPDVFVPASCTSSSDCAAGETCLGGEGCAIPWHCGPALGRPCTDDIAPFCGCDGVTFFGSSSCPPHPFQYRGPCELPPPPMDGGPPPPPPGLCASDADCIPGTVCTGPEGCGAPRFCVPSVGCSPGAATFCGCDGVTFTASSTCPTRSFAHLGACRSVDDAGPDACVLPDGTRCPAGETCPLDRCTTCYCGSAGVVSCEINLACVDGGVADAGPPPPIDF